MNNSKNYANANFELKLQILFAFIIQNYDFINQSRIILGGKKEFTSRVAKLYNMRFNENI